MSSLLPLAKRHGGQIVLEQLRALGARRVFLVAGESFLPCIDAFNEHQQHIQPVVCRQESGAAYMAEAYGKLTGEPGICMVTRGPGATNAAIGVHTARQDSTPMILFIGQVPTDFTDREAFQELDYRQMFSQMAKWVAQIDKVERIPEYIARAWSVATNGRPGPVVLALPEDVLFSVSDVAIVPPRPKLEIYPAQTQLQQLVQLLAQATRPFLLLGGSGWHRQASQHIHTFVQRFDLPVGVAWRRLECYDQRSEHFAGQVGFGMDEALRQQLLDSDLIIALGTRITEATSEGYQWIQSPLPRQKLVHIYPDSGELGRVYSPALAINASVNGVAEQLATLRPTTPPVWREWRRQAHENWKKTLIPLPAPGQLSLDQVSHITGEVLQGKGCITVGAGNYALYPHRYITYTGHGSSLASTVGTMGYGLPAAISFKLEYPDLPAVCFAGDGCFQMTLQELGVALHYQLGIVILVFNNGMWGTIRAHQERHFPDRNIALSFTNPDFAALAAAWQGLGIVVDHTSQFEAALRNALDFASTQRRPAIIELRYDGNGIAPGLLLSDIRRQALEKTRGKHELSNLN